MRRTRFPSTVVASAVVVGLLAGGGGAYGYVASTASTRLVCVSPRTHVLYLGQHCKHLNLRGPAGPPGPNGAAVYSTYKDGPVQAGPANFTFASLSIPAPGDYVIFAKLWAQGGSGNGTGQGFMQANCQLTAGNDYDQSSAYALYSMSSAGGGPEAPLALNVVHYYAGPGTATLSCTSQYGSFLHFIKITAISVGSLSNTPSP